MIFYKVIKVNLELKGGVFNKGYYDMYKIYLDIVLFYECWKYKFKGNYKFNNKIYNIVSFFLEN